MKTLSKEERERLKAVVPEAYSNVLMLRALRTIDEFEKERDSARLSESDLLISRVEALTVIEQLKSRQKTLVEALRKIASTYNSNPCCLESIHGSDGKEHRDWCHRGIAAASLREIGEGGEG